MKILKLWFSSGPNPELLKTHFEHPLLSEPKLTVRGRTSGPFSHVGTFQWRPAVQALTMLILKATISQPDRKSEPLLTGSVGSPASSLEFMLRKRPDWLKEMFGTTSNGDLIIDRLISRHNPANRRPGGMALSLSAGARDNFQIEIYIDSLRTVKSSDLLTLLTSIEAAWKPHSTATHTYALAKKKAVESKINPSSHLSPEVKRRLNAIIREEIVCILRMTDIFSASSYSNVVRRIHSHPLFVRIAGRKANLFERSEGTLPTNDEYGYEHDERTIKRILNSETPIRVFMAAIPSSAAAMFTYLRDVKGYNIEICFDHDHAGDLVTIVENQCYKTPPDLVVFGLPSATRIFNQSTRHGFSPFMPLPRHSVRLVGAQKEAGSLKQILKKGALYCGCDQPTSALFALSALEEAGAINQSDINLVDSSPTEAFARMRSGDPDAHSLLFFPHHQFNRMFNGASYLDSAHMECTLVDSVLMAHESVFYNPAKAFALNRAIRNAWLDLSEGGVILDSLIDSMLDDPRYVRRMAHSAGLTEQELVQVRFDNVA